MLPLFFILDCWQKHRRQAEAIQLLERALVSFRDKSYAELRGICLPPSGDA